MWFRIPSQDMEDQRAAELDSGPAPSNAPRSLPGPLTDEGSVFTTTSTNEKKKRKKKKKIRALNPSDDTFTVTFQDVDRIVENPPRTLTVLSQSSVNVQEFTAENVASRSSKAAEQVFVQAQEVAGKNRNKEGRASVGKKPVSEYADSRTQTHGKDIHKQIHNLCASRADMSGLTIFQSRRASPRRL